MAISFVADNQWTSTSANTTFTLNRPTGVTSGDVMVAFVAMDLYPTSGSRTVTPPTGWTLLESTYAASYLMTATMIRTAGSSEPASWSGSISGSSASHRASVIAAYRGAGNISIDGESTAGSGTSLNTATVNNSAATNWRITAGVYVSSSTSYTITSNEVTQREVATATGGSQSGGIQVGLWDSNGTISTGNTSRNISRGAAWESAATWIGTLTASDTGTTGTLAASVPSLPTVSIAAQKGYQGTLAATVPSLPTMTASGIASPPEGTLGVVVTPSMSADAIHEAAGTVDTVVTPVMNIVGETRKFGIRVITPEAETRVVKPRLGAAD